MVRPVGGWELLFRTEPDERKHLPTFLRIARAIAEDARRGRLAPGARLPGSRELAQSLGVHRNTVLAAYRELTAEGFLESQQGLGTFLTSTLPELHPRRLRGRSRARPPAQTPGFDFSPPPALPSPPALHPGTLKLYGGLPDTRLVPREALSRAYRRALRARPELLGYGDPRGEATLRKQLADMLRAKRGLSVTEDDLLITRGAQMALALLARLLFKPGDVVAVEAFGYRPAFRALMQTGAVLRGIPVDHEGIRVDALQALCARERVRAVYVTPHHQYPTTVTLSPGRRMALLSLARERRFAILEDDYDHEFHYEGRPVLPLASADEAGVVLYVGTLSKVFAPGLRMGYLIAPACIRDAAADLRVDLDRQGDRLSERALAELLEDGELQRHVRRAQRIYRARRDHMAAMLREQLGEWLSFEVPPGGMALWSHVSAELHVAAWLNRAEQLGVTAQPGQLFCLEGQARPNVRIGYAALDERDLSTAVGRLRRAALEVLGRRRRSKA